MQCFFIVCVCAQVRGKWDAMVAGKLKEENKKNEITPPDDRSVDSFTHHALGKRV